MNQSDWRVVCEQNVSNASRDIKWQYDLNVKVQTQQLYQCYVSLHLMPCAHTASHQLDKPASVFLLHHQRFAQDWQTS